MAREFITLDTRVDTFKTTYNSLTNKVGDLVNLTTTGDSDLVEAINEHDAELGLITAGAMGTTASTVSTAIKELDSDRDRLVTYTGMPVAITGMDNSSTNVLSTAVLNLDSALGNRTSLSTKNSTTFVAAINEIHDSIGEVLMTTTATTIKSAINELDSDRDRLTTYTGMPVAITGMDNSTGNVISTALLNLDSALGNRVALTTTADQDLVVAINELDAEHGVLSSLSTSAKSTFVASINEIFTDIGNVTAGNMGTTASTLTTAIAELEAEIDTLNTKVEPAQSLNTSASTLADAINEHDAEIGTVTTGAMGTSASTIVTAIKEITDELGNVTAGAMGTSASTIVTAIAEHETNINANKATIDSDTGVVNAANMGTVAHTIVNAINELHTSVDNLDGDATTNPVGAIASLTTTVKSSIVNAINSLDSDVGTRTSLNTTADQDLVVAINEVFGHVGTIASLNTTADANLVVAINEVSNRAINVKDSDGTLLNTL